MSQFEDMRMFVETVAHGSFTAAAEHLQLSKQQVSKRIAALEARLGARLLLRTTRRLHVTELGLAYLERAQRILQELDDAEQMVASRSAEPRGLLRLSAPMSFGTMHLGPVMPAFLARHPHVSLELELNDRMVDLVAEGYDMAIRIGVLADSSLVARRIAPMRQITCASAGYLHEHGVPSSPGELSGHACLLYGHGPRTSWHYLVDGRELAVPVQGRMRANNGEMLRDAAIAGQGLVQLPGFIVAPALADGRLVSVLDDVRPAASTVYAVYPQHRQTSLLVRAFSDFLRECFAVARFVAD